MFVVVSSIMSSFANSVLQQFPLQVQVLPGILIPELVIAVSTVSASTGNTYTRTGNGNFQCKCQYWEYPEYPKLVIAVSTASARTGNTHTGTGNGTATQSGSVLYLMQCDEV